MERQYRQYLTPSATHSNNYRRTLSTTRSVVPVTRGNVATITRSIQIWSDEYIH